MDYKPNNKFVLVYNTATKKIIINQQIDNKTVSTKQTYLEFDTQDELNAQITALGLTK